jgi:hypothetical protein
VQAAQQATAAAQTALSSPAAAQAAQATQTALAAAASNNPALAQQAANQAVQAAQTAVLSTTAATQNQPAPVPSTAAPMLAGLAANAANEIRSKGCWHESRPIIQAYQQAEGGTLKTPGRAGVADGYWGPATALAAMSYLPKVPAPCYWPQQPAARAKAQKDWAALVKAGKVTVGGNSVYVGGGLRAGDTC